MRLNIRNKMLLLAIIFSVIFSGCTEEKTIKLNKSDTNDPSADSPVYQKTSHEGSVNLTSVSTTMPSEDGENISEFTPEFTLESFTGIYVRDNHNENPKHIISERRYAVYNLSIKNNGSKTSRFILSKLHLISRNGSLTPSSMDDVSTYPFNEIKLENISLLPGQITRGYVAFNVDSMYDRSFMLMYNSKPVELTSFENSILSIEKADLFDYSIAMGKPPYHIQDFGLPDTYDPPQPEFYTDRGIAYSLIWSNWVNRSIVEFFKKLDLKELNNIKRDCDLPSTYSTYALKVIPGKNISIHHGNPVVITGENNEELTSAYYSDILISDNSTFRRLSDTFTDDMNFSNATLVNIFFDNAYGWSMATRFNRNNQIVVMDENRKIVYIGFQYDHFVS